MTTSAYRVDVHLNLGMIYLVKENLTQALDFFTQAHELAIEIERRDILPGIHYRLGELMRNQGDLPAAQRHIETSIQLVEDLRNPLHDEGMKIGLLGRWQQLYESMLLLYLEQDDLHAALHIAERSRSRAFLDMVASSPSLTDNKSSDEGLDEPLTAREIQERLPADAALIEFFATGQPGTSEGIVANLPSESQRLRKYLLSPEHLFAFIVTRESVQVLELDISIEQIQSQLFHHGDGRLRGITPLPGKRLRVMRRWQDVGAKLLQPLRSFVTGRRHLFFVPHSLLHYLPFHALIDLSTMTGIRDTTFSYAPSASLLLRSTYPNNKSAQRPRLLSLGGLDHAEAEANWIAQCFGGEILLGDEATMVRVCDALPFYDVVHFSCHGHFRQRTPLESALELSDGELTAANLLESVQLNADLVTLSACDTGLNVLHPGDELMGLTRAILGCGARSLLATLWPVHEIPTRLFIEHFYEMWMAGATKARAVQETQRFVANIDINQLHARFEQYGMAPEVVLDRLRLFQAMLPDQKPFDHPYYWGGFILIGAPD